MTTAQRIALLACGRDADSLDGQKNVRDAENAQKAAPYPQVQCTLCWAALTYQMPDWNDNLLS